MTLATPALILALLAAPAFAQQPTQQAPNLPLNTPPSQPQQQDNPNTFSRPDMIRIVTDVRKKLAGLPDYEVFDYLYFGIQGRNLVLQGFASRPLVKNEAGNAVKGMEGVERVQNDIKVLPLSPMDDRIRIEVYRRIYTFPTLRKYTGSPVGFGEFPSIAREAGGITQDPPRGFHAIHIIVANGRVTLYGVVDNEQDSDAAYIQANSAPGAFQVTNDLLYPGKKPGEK